MTLAINDSHVGAERLEISMRIWKAALKHHCLKKRFHFMNRTFEWLLQTAVWQRRICYYQNMMLLLCLRTPVVICSGRFNWLHPCRLFSNYCHVYSSLCPRSWAGSFTVTHKGTWTWWCTCNQGELSPPTVEGLYYCPKGPVGTTCIMMGHVFLTWLLLYSNQRI